MVASVLLTRRRCLTLATNKLGGYTPIFALTPKPCSRRAYWYMPAEDLTSVYGNGWQAVFPIYGTACATASYSLCNCVLRIVEMAILNNPGTHLLYHI